MLAMVKEYRQKPSEIIGLSDSYEAFCFDEACLYIIQELSKEDPKTPRFVDDLKVQHNNSDIMEWLNSNNRV